MARILLLVVFCVMVKASHKHHPKFPKVTEDYDSSTQTLKRVNCSPDHENRRNEIIQQSKCGEPKDTFIYLVPQSAHQQVSPGAVWVKRCKGLCDYDTYGSKCVAISKRTIYIPIRIYNLKSNKEMCSQYPVEEHISCGCCAAGDACASPRQFDPRKCSCRCPNRTHRRHCRSQLNRIMRWNPSKCRCEERKRIKGTS